jgi:hypothetical protein
MDKRRILFRGRKIDLALQEVTLRDGTVAEREVVLHRGAVALVPMVDDEHVCLVRNRRYAVDRTLLEVPAARSTAVNRPTGPPSASYWRRRATRRAEFVASGSGTSAPG